MRNSLLLSGGISILFALILGYFTRGPVNLSRRDGFGVVTFGWLSVTLFGSLPYLLSGVITHPVSALFETMSGFTTTGASVLTQLESIPFDPFLAGVNQLVWGNGCTGFVCRYFAFSRRRRHADIPSRDAGSVKRSPYSAHYHYGKVVVGGLSFVVDFRGIAIAICWGHGLV